MLTLSEKLTGSWDPISQMPGTNPDSDILMVRLELIQWTQLNQSYLASMRGAFGLFVPGPVGLHFMV